MMHTIKTDKFENFERSIREMLQALYPNIFEISSDNLYLNPLTCYQFETLNNDILFKTKINIFAFSSINVIQLKVKSCIFNIEYGDTIYQHKIILNLQQQYLSDDRCFFFYKHGIDVNVFDVKKLDYVPCEKVRIMRVYTIKNIING